MKYAAEATYEDSFVWDRMLPASGPWVHDPDGNLWLDFAGHIAVNAVGYNHPEIVNLFNDPIAGKILTATPDRTAGTDFISAAGPDPARSMAPMPSHLHGQLHRFSPKQLNKSFFVNSGAEAVENAAKLAWAYKKNYGYAVTFDGAFHGRTLGALSLNRSKHVQRRWYPEIPKVLTARYNDPYWLSKLRVDPEEIAFVIAEPFQGEGGYIPATPEFMASLSIGSTKHDFPLIIDEIQAGIGRTGKFWCFENYDIIPDMVTAGKALQISAVLGKEKYFPTEKGRISGTWAEGNIINSALGYMVIKIIMEDQLMESAYQTGAYFRNKLRQIPMSYVKMFNHVRGMGLMIGATPAFPEYRDMIVEEAAKKGLLLIGCGKDSIRFLPPLNVNMHEVDVCIEILEEIGQIFS
jgi:4-aminobutyrate aminotransferase